MKRTLLLAGLLALTTAAQAEINVGLVVSATGPAASLGVLQRNTAALLPTTIAGQKVNYIVLDDGSDTTNAVTDARKLIQENKVDLIMGTTTSPGSLAMIDVVAEARVPMISLAAASQIILPMDAKRAWVFKVAQNDGLMAEGVAAHMLKSGVKTVGFIGFNDSYGESWLSEFGAAAARRGIKIVDTERYGRSDTSVTGQALKLVAARPDAILIAGTGVPATVPAKALAERGYSGKVYQTHGVTNNDFLRVGGKDVEGTILPAGPNLNPALLPDSVPSKKVAQNYNALYDAKYGAGTTSPFGANLWDAGLIFQKAVPVALKKGKPGTPAFRAALRDALENTRNVIGAAGVYTMTPGNHNGLDARGRIMATISGGTWKLLK